MDLSFFKLNIEKIGLRLKSLISIDAKVNVEVDKRKVEVEMNTLTQIQEQKNLNAPITNNTFVLVAGSDQAKEIVQKIAGVSDVPSLISPSATGEATLPEIEEEDGATKLLKKYLKEHTDNPDFLLDRGRLLFFYEERQNVDLKEDALVFLLQSSLKVKFPFWYWTYLYREKFGNVIPLLEVAFKTTDIKIRLEVVNILKRFSDTAENIVQLAMSENNELVLGAMVVKLASDADRAQRVIANAISRKLIPQLDYKDIKSLIAPLGKNEKKFLTDTILNGWPNEKVKALNILSVTATEEDLPLLEGIFENETYRETTYSTLHCIERIGKTNIAERIEKELDDARWEGLFLQAVGTLVAVKDKNILPKLFSWLKDSSGFASRFSSEFHEWSVSDKIKNAILELMDKDFYEVIVQDILSQPKGKYLHLYVWRQFNLLKDVVREEIIELIRKETRLSEFVEWKELLDSVNSNEVIERKEKDGLLALATVPANYTTAMLSLRELWKIIPQDEALKTWGVIESLRKDLMERLEVFATGEYPQEQKDIAAKGLDYFLGENGIYNRPTTTKRKSWYEDEEKDPFSSLMNDISKFERIEDEYFDVVFEKKDDATKAFLLEQIGRPYENIYAAITPDWIKKGEVEGALQKAMENTQNNLIKLPIIGAETRIGIIPSSLARAAIKKLLDTARAELKKHGMTRNNDGWLLNHNTYFRAISTLGDIGDADDLPLVKEATNRETILKRYFHFYSSFHDIRTLRELYGILDTLKDDEEQANLQSTLENLDYTWTKELLSIES